MSKLKKRSKSEEDLRVLEKERYKRFCFDLFRKEIEEKYRQSENPTAPWNNKSGDDDKTIRDVELKSNRIVGDIRESITADDNNRVSSLYTDTGKEVSTGAKEISSINGESLKSNTVGNGRSTAEAKGGNNEYTVIDTSDCNVGNFNKSSTDDVNVVSAIAARNAEDINSECTSDTNNVCTDGYITNISESNGESMTYASDSNGDSVTNASNSNGESVTYASNSNGESVAYASDCNDESMTCSSDRNGEPVTYISDSNGECPTPTVYCIDVITAADSCNFDEGIVVATSNAEVEHISDIEVNKEATAFSKEGNRLFDTIKSGITKDSRSSNIKTIMSKRRRIRKVTPSIRMTRSSTAAARIRTRRNAVAEIYKQNLPTIDRDENGLLNTSENGRYKSSTKDTKIRNGDFTQDTRRSNSKTIMSFRRCLRKTTPSKSTTRSSTAVVRIRTRKNTVTEINKQNLPTTDSDDITKNESIGIKKTKVVLNQNNNEIAERSSPGNEEAGDRVIGTKHHFVTGMVVWAEYGRKPSRYIGLVIPSIPRVPNNSHYYRNIYWFGEHTVSRVPVKKIKHFLDKEVYEERNEIPLNDGGILEAIKVICDQYKLLGKTDQPQSLDQFITWINEECFVECDYTIPSYILKNIEKISNKGIEIDPEDGPEKSCENVQITKFSIDFEQRDPSTICLGCREVTSSKGPHPLVEGALCKNCLARVAENHIVLRVNQQNFRYCSICGWLDKYIFCKTCKRVVCRTCVMFWFKEEIYQKAARNIFTWKCIFCKPPDKTAMYTKLVALNVDSNAQVFKFPYEESHWPEQGEVNVVKNADEDKPALRVLSLFDGISTGMIALSNLGIKVEKYFASEVDCDAIMVTKRKFGDSVEHIGDIRNITSETVKKFLPIHLLIGGSPCNDLSKVNHSRKGLTDLNGSGSLFFEFYRVLKLIDEHQGHPRTFFYVFENVSSMDIMHKDTMSRFFESSPICIDAKFMAAMSRPRLFWGNIPQMGTLAKEFLENVKDCQGSMLQDHLTPNLRRKATVRTIRTVTTNNNSLIKNDGSPQVVMEGEASTLSVTEIEKVFGFPEHYTDVMNLTPNKRRKLLGKAWCVQVIQALFRPLTQIFQMKSEEDQPVE